MMSLPGFDTVLDQCLAVRVSEKVLLLTDDLTDRNVIDRLVTGIEQRGSHCKVLTIPIPTLPGAEPPDEAADQLLEADAAIELTSLFIGSNQARQAANKAGTRYLAMPGVVLDTFRVDGPLDVDFDELSGLSLEVGSAWDNGTRFRLTSLAGTDLTGSIAGRSGRVLNGIARGEGDYMAPPDIEAGTAPVEGTVSGVAVIDADLLFMGVGPLPEPVYVYFERGVMVSAEGPDKERLESMIERCNDPRMVNFAEVSMGLNPNGTICGVAMETESALGTAHVALGNSIAYGGTVDAVAHLDCVMASATLEIDGEVIISNGELA